LNGNESARIARATQERVREAAVALGYRPNRMARSLGRRRTDTIGLLISGLRNPFFVELLETAERLAEEAGYEVLLDSAPSVHGTFMGHGKVVGGWPVDGALIWATAYQHAESFLGQQAESIPVVYLGAERGDGSDWVSFDYYQGGRLAVEHLAGRGYKRIAYVTPYAFGIDRHDEPRNAAYNDVCAAAGLPTTQILTREEETRAAGLRAGQQVAAMPAGERPDALFCHNDMLAVGVYCGLRRSGLRVPDDVAVVGFDGVEETQYLDIPLTTVRTSGETLCRRALDALSRRMAGDAETPPLRAVLPAELVLGASS
jgi:DNA-binding LacI/PurR family transcriptional regulator